MLADPHPSLSKIIARAKRSMRALLKPGGLVQTDIDQVYDDLEFIEKLATALLTKRGVKVRIVEVPFADNPMDARFFHRFHYKVGQIIKVVPIRDYRCFPIVYLDISSQALDNFTQFFYFEKHQLRRVK